MSNIKIIIYISKILKYLLFHKLNPLNLIFRGFFVLFTFMKTKKRREKVNSTIKESTIEKFTDFCEKNNINKSKLIERLIKEHIDKENLKK